MGGRQISKEAGHGFFTPPNSGTGGDREEVAPLVLVAPSRKAAARRPKSPSCMRLVFSGATGRRNRYPQTPNLGHGGGRSPKNSGKEAKKNQKACPWSHEKRDSNKQGQ